MNRDEKRTRLTALPPAVVHLPKRNAIFPCEPDGGTWIAANAAGVCLALINWHTIKREPSNAVASRGLVVQTLADAASAEEIAKQLTNLPLKSLRPFRLITIIPFSKKVIEWRWDLIRLSKHNRPWKLQHWFSSGLDEPAAEKERAKTCATSLRLTSRAGLAWLRRLHRSHLPKRGPFSICMHRPDAATVSYTEVVVSGHRTTMRYKPGPTCHRRPVVTKSLSLAKL